MKNLKYRLWYFSLMILIFSCGRNDQGLIYRHQRTMNIDGWERSYLINLPPGFYEMDHLPLVIALHGTGGSAVQCERDYGLTKKANETNFVIVYPEGVPKPGLFGIRTWNAGKCCDYAAINNIDDVEFISELIDQMVHDYKVDPDKVYVTGMSNGAMLAYRLACEIPNKLNAVAPVSGSMMTTSCNPSKPVPILHIHSELDEVVPYYGGTGLGGYYFPPVDSVLYVWAELNDCVESPVVKDGQGYTYEKCAGEDVIFIEHYLTKDGGHSWPGGLIARPGADLPSKAIDATALIWEFFERH